MKRLEGQVALVTGGGGGIGKAIALALGAEGARLAIADLKAELVAPAVAEAEALGIEAMACPVNVTDAAAVKTAVQTVLGRYGRIDILMNTAGINVPNRWLPEITVENWRAIVDVNLTGAFIVTRAVLPHMRERQRGTIINLASWAGKRNCRIAGVAYSASKAAMIALTEGINMEERQYGIRACSINPGEVNSPVVMKRTTPPSPAERAAMLAVEDVAAAVVFVATMPDRATVEEVALRPTFMRAGYDDQVLPRRE